MKMDYHSPICVYSPSLHQDTYGHQHDFHDPFGQCTALVPTCCCVRSTVFRMIPNITGLHGLHGSRNYSPVLLVFIPISSWFHARFYCLRHVLLLKSQCFAGPFFKENSSPSLLVISALLFVNYKRFFVWIKRQNHAKPPFMMLKS